MLTEHHIVNLPDLGKNAKFELEVNWDAKNPATNDSKVVRLSCECGKTAYVARERLNEFLFAIGTGEDQQKMIPQTISRVHEQVLKLAIKATKDIWEARVSLDYRMTFQIVSGYYILRNVGHHDPALKNP